MPSTTRKVEIFELDFKFSAWNWNIVTWYFPAFAELLTLACSCKCVSLLLTFSTALPVSWARSKCLCYLYSLANIDSFLFERVITKCRFRDITAISVLLTFLTLSRVQMLWLLQEGCSCPTVMGLLASVGLFPSYFLFPLSPTNADGVEVYDLEYTLGVCVAFQRAKQPRFSHVKSLESEDTF